MLPIWIAVTFSIESFLCEPATVTAETSPDGGGSLIASISDLGCTLGFNCSPCPSLLFSLLSSTVCCAIFLLGCNDVCLLKQTSSSVFVSVVPHWKLAQLFPQMKVVQWSFHWQAGSCSTKHLQTNSAQFNFVYIVPKHNKIISRHFTQWSQDFMELPNKCYLSSLRRWRREKQCLNRGNFQQNEAQDIDRTEINWSQNIACSCFTNMFMLKTIYVHILYSVGWMAYVSLNLDYWI